MPFAVRYLAQLFRLAPVGCCTNNVNVNAAAFVGQHRFFSATGPAAKGPAAGNNSGSVDMTRVTQKKGGIGGQEQPVKLEICGDIEGMSSCVCTVHIDFALQQR